MEFPRDHTASVLKLIGGVFLAVVDVALVTAPSTQREPVGGIVVGAITGLLALLVIVNNLRLVIQRPIALRADAAGLWFGGGPIIPWQEVTMISESIATFSMYGAMTAKSGGIAIAFRHKRTVLRLPMGWWLTWFNLGVARVSTTGMPQVAASVAAELERMRFAACGDEDGALPGASSPPAARVVRRRSNPA